MNIASDHRPDLADRTDIIRVVDRFYARIQRDEKLGPIFDEIARVDWATHLPRMYDFWDSVLFRAGTFRGDPIGVHARLVAQADMSLPTFRRWLALFRETVEELYAGHNAGILLRSAEDMANVIYSKINDVPDPRFDPANLTPEQKARYAAYRGTACQSPKDSMNRGWLYLIEAGFSRPGPTPVLLPRLCQRARVVHHLN